MILHETYQKKENRDARAKELRKLYPTKEGYKVVRRSHRNQLLHPMYIKDYEEKLSKEDCGFGNTMYKTYFSAIYIVDVE